LALAAAFEKKNPILKKISLYNCAKVNDECISCIMAALEKSDILEELKCLLETMQGLQLHQSVNSETFESFDG
jgi:hypothetical protein